MAYYSPLRYPGGKGRLSDYMKLIIQENNLLDGIYVEPFAGGAGIALSLLINEFVTKIVINDISKSIYSFWYTVLNFNKELCKKIIDTPVTVEEWYKQKEVQNNIEKHTIFEVGFSTFYLNRTNRSGILTGGVIGGFEQSGKWKIDARFNKKNLIDRIKKIGMYKDRVSLYNLDAEKLIKDEIVFLPDDTLVYLDPPYFNKGRHLYENYYNDKDHSRLGDVITKYIDHKWLITYDNTTEISNIYNKYKKRTYSLSYSASNRYEGSEIMIYSENLIIPNVENPVKVKV